MKAVKKTKITKHKSGLYTLRYTENGKQKSLYGKTKSICLQKYALIKKASKRPKGRSISFLFWYEEYIQVYKSHLKENTLRNLKAVFTNHILPKIATKPLRQITSLEIQKIINDMQNITRQQTIAYIELNACFQQAYKLGYISHNPCLACVIKKNKGRKGKALTEEQQAKLLEYLKLYPAPVNTLVLLYINLGVRCSELLNIEQQDINYKTNEIHIKGTKTKTSNRVIQTRPEVLALIPDKARPFEEWNKDKVAREFKKITTALKFKGITIHSLRHTFATNCIQSGVDMFVVQKWLGHASIKMTIDRYTHISNDFKKEQANKTKLVI